MLRSAAQQSAPRVERHPDCVTIARRLVHSDQRVVGAFPMSPSMGLLPLLSSLASGLADFGHYHVGLLDPVLGWPCWKEDGDAVEMGAQQFRGRWIAGPQVAAIAPRRRPEAGSLVETVAALIEYARPRCEYVLVDTSGLMPTGADLTVLAQLDAGFVVARAHQTTERELLARHNHLPEHQRLGVILVS